MCCGNGIWAHPSVVVYVNHLNHLNGLVINKWGNIFIRFHTPSRQVILFYYMETDKFGSLNVVLEICNKKTLRVAACAFLGAISTPMALVTQRRLSANCWLFYEHIIVR